MTHGLHAVAEDVSLGLHRAVAERLLEKPALLDRARERVAGWLREGTPARPYADGAAPEGEGGGREPASRDRIARQIEADPAT